MKIQKGRIEVFYCNMCGEEFLSDEYKQEGVKKSDECINCQSDCITY